MPFADVTDGTRVIAQAMGAAVPVVLSEAAKVGDLLGQVSSTWKLADTDAATPVYGELVAGEAGASGDTIPAYVAAVVRILAHGGAKGDVLYATTVAGGYSATATLQAVGVALNADDFLVAPKVNRATLVEGAAKLYFRDSATYLSAVAVGKLESGRAIAVETEKKVAVSISKTLAKADCGIIQDVDTDATVTTLPSTAAGLAFIVRNAGADGAVLVSISPAAPDKIEGAGLTAADNKDLLNTKATAKKGDFVLLVSDGVDGYTVAQMVGTWAREV